MVTSIQMAYSLNNRRSTFGSGRCYNLSLVEEVEAAARQQKRSGDARALGQLVKKGNTWTDIPPKMWGITISQFKELMEEVMAHPSWRKSKTVTSLVFDFIKPMTAKKGVGYALFVNWESPLEANVMISHAWQENAEEFFETLERSVEKEDVLWICALALYQNEDGHGPSVKQQVGETIEENPFRTVLQNIRNCGAASTWRLQSTGPDWMRLLALTLTCCPLLWRGCVPTLAGECGSIVDCQFIPFYPGWAAVSLVLFFTSVVLKNNVFGIRTVCQGYRGYMLAVPNRNCELYSRLWCVYEIFVASMLGVPVELAKTLVQPSSAGGGGGSPARAADCFDIDDKARIQREIEEYGMQQGSGTAEHGYDLVDNAIKRVTTRKDNLAKVQKFKMGLRVSLLFATALPYFHQFIRNGSGRLELMWETRYPWSVTSAMAGAVCGCALSFGIAYKTAKRRAGRLYPWDAPVTVAVISSLGGVAFVAYFNFKFLPLSNASVVLTWFSYTLGFTMVFNCAIVTIVVVVVAICIRKALGWQWRFSLPASIAIAAFASCCWSLALISASQICPAAGDQTLVNHWAEVHGLQLPVAKQRLEIYQQHSSFDVLYIKGVLAGICVLFIFDASVEASSASINWGIHWRGGIADKDADRDRTFGIDHVELRSS